MVVGNRRFPTIEYLFYLVSKIPKIKSMTSKCQSLLVFADDLRFYKTGEETGKKTHDVTIIVPESTLFTLVREDNKPSIIHDHDSTGHNYFSANLINASARNFNGFVDIRLGFTKRSSMQSLKPGSIITIGRIIDSPFMYKDFETKFNECRKIVSYPECENDDAMLVLPVRPTIRASWISGLFMLEYIL
jgi:hypothetical protein